MGVAILLEGGTPSLQGGVCGLGGLYGLGGPGGPGGPTDLDHPDLDQRTCGWSGSAPLRTPPAPRRRGPIGRFRPVSAGFEAVVLPLFLHMRDFRRISGEVRGLLNLGPAERRVCGCR
jgi:hypothetical protein